MSEEEEVEAVLSAVDAKLVVDVVQPVLERLGESPEAIRGAAIVVDTLGNLFMTTAVDDNLPDEMAMVITSMALTLTRQALRELGA